MAISYLLLVTVSLTEEPPQYGTRRSILYEDWYHHLIAYPLKTIAEAIKDLSLIILGPITLILITSIVKLLGYLVDKLKGDHKLKGYMRIAGIVLFIFGNIFQFIATFH